MKGPSVLLLFFVVLFLSYGSIPGNLTIDLILIDLQVMNTPVRSLDKQSNAFFVNENQENEDTVATIEEFLGATQIKIPYPPPPPHHSKKW